jgi:hypothetical protein
MRFKGTKRIWYTQCALRKSAKWNYPAQYDRIEVVGAGGGIRTHVAPRGHKLLGTLKCLQACSIPG